MQKAKTQRLFIYHDDGKCTFIMVPSSPPLLQRWGRGVLAFYRDTAWQILSEHFSIFCFFLVLC